MPPLPSVKEPGLRPVRVGDVGTQRVLLPHAQLATWPEQLSDGAPAQRPLQEGVVAKLPHLMAI
eukprot:9486659-Pyramimonas_sp.AAC.1